MVELISHFGNDLMVVNAARVSYGKYKESFDEIDKKLIKYLVEHNHTSVFRHPQLQFRITCPLYVAIQLEKHQVGMSLNGISGRYVGFSASYTHIEKGNWRIQSKNSKQGSEGLLDSIYQEECDIIQKEVYEFCKARYDRLMELNVAKEQARTILPLNLNTTFIWTGSLLSFIHLFHLRLKEDTQKEIQNIAKQMVQCIKEIPENPFEHSLKAFGLN